MSKLQKNHSWKYLNRGEKKIEKEGKYKNTRSPTINVEEKEEIEVSLLNISK